jgi:hypothetical protein
VSLRASKQARLQRLYPKASWRSESGQLLLPVTSAAAAPAELVAALDDLLEPVPPPS